MKIIIPVAGIGSKLRPHTHTQPKALVPVAGKPILSHIIDDLVEDGYSEFIFIIGYLGDKIEDYVRTKYPDINPTFVVQEPRVGTGHAVWLAKDKIEYEDDLLIILGDSIIDFNAKEIKALNYSSIGLKKVEDPRNFGVAEMDDSSILIKVEEKPVIPKSNLAITGIYYFKQAGKLFDALDHLIKNNLMQNAEYSLTNAIQRMITQGELIIGFQAGNWFDCGSKASLLETNAVLLKRKLKDKKNHHHYHNTIIIEPVSIADHCVISDAIIGPNVSIGEHTIVRHTILSDSIIGSYAQIESAILHQSLIGSDAFLKGLSQSLNVGDSTELDFS